MKKPLYKVVKTINGFEIARKYSFFELFYFSFYHLTIGNCFDIKERADEVCLLLNNPKEFEKRMNEFKKGFLKNLKENKTL